MNRITIPALVPLFFLAATCDASDASSLVTDIDRQMASVRTLTADFVQIKKMAMFDMPLDIRGTIHVAKPEKFAWKVKTPVEYALVMDGNMMRKWDAETGNTTKISLDGNPVADTAVRQIKLWFSGQYSAFTKDYDVTVVSENPAVLMFKPKPDNPAAGMIETVTVRFREDKRYISRIRIMETGGDETLIRFENIRVNKEIPPSAWTPGQ